MADNSPARGTPEPQSPAASVSEAAPEAPSRSLPSQESTATERASKAKSPGEILSLLSDLRKAKPEPVAAEVAPAAPAPVEPAESAAEEPAALEPEKSAEGGEETPTEETPAAPAPPEEAEEEDDGGEGPISPITGKRAHLRLAENDKVGRLAASFMKRNRDMGMEEAIERARNQLGIKPEAAATETAPAAKSNLPQTVEAVDSELESIESQRDKAFTELRFEDVAKLDRSIRQLDRHRLNLEREAERTAAKQETEYSTAFSNSEIKASALYDFVVNPESEGHKRMIEIDEALKEYGDPLYASPDKPLRIAQMVAAELKIAPKRKGAPPAPAKAVVPPATTPTVKKQILPGGGSRTTPPATNPTTAVADATKSVKTPHELRNFLKTLGVKSF